MDDFLVEINDIVEKLNLINDKYKDTVTKGDMEKAKGQISKALNRLTGSAYNPITNIRIGCDDRVDSTAKFRELILNSLNIELIRGATNDWTLYKEVIWINVHDDYVTFYKTKDKDDDVLMIELRDKLMNKLINEFNTRSVYLNTKLADGFTNWEFFDGKAFNRPEPTWFDKIYEVLAKLSN